MNFPLGEIVNYVYDSKKQTLTIRFHTGNLYEFIGLNSQVYDVFNFSKEQNNYFYNSIFGHFQQRQVFDSVKKVTAGGIIITPTDLEFVDSSTVSFTVDDGKISATATGTGGVTSVSATLPLTSNPASTTPDISTSMNTNKLIGRGTAGSGVMEEITLGTNISLTGTTLNVEAVAAFITAISDTNSIDLTVTVTTLSADLRIQNSTTINLSVDASGLKAVFASLLISQFTNDAGYLTALTQFLSSVLDTNSIDLTAALGVLSADLRKQNSTTVNLSIDASGLKADFASMNISQFTNDVPYLTTTGITPAALTNVDDTNVTLSISAGGATALLNATVITAGWTGTLADGRIASAATWNAKASATDLANQLSQVQAMISYRI